ncbi:MAG TPA: hypothetical protein ENJ39_04355 [Flammeovirgaceae bacterium]|nr:hypothetical protein [Flammeovirgaceae bacterium]
MNKILKVLRIISTITGAIVLTFFVVGTIIWGIDTDSLEYGRNPLVTNENLDNEGPFIFEKDSVYLINYIKGNKINGYYLKQYIENLDADFSVKCYYYLDSTDFSFKLNKNLQNEKFLYESPEKIIAVSDIESDYKAFRNFLRANNVVDENLNWVFGKGHLVLIGDFIDRSYFTTQVLWFIYKLEQDAESNGGKVHYILGNHEIMNMQGDYRYAKKKYRDIAAILGLKQYQLYDTTTHLGKWLQTKNVVEKIGNFIFVHGGISPELPAHELGLAEINKIARKNYLIPYFPKLNRPENEQLILSTKTSPYWYRGYFNDDISQNEIDRIIKYYKCSQIIVGHTVQKKVNKFYNGKIIGIDVKHPKDYYRYFPEIHLQGLLIENDKFYRINDKGERTGI